MSEEPQHSKLTDKPATDPVEAPERRRFRIADIVAIVVFIVVIIYNAGELSKELHLDQAAQNQSMFSIPAELQDHESSCGYKYLFICGTKPPPPDVPGCDTGTNLEKAACNLDDNGQAGNPPSHSIDWASIPYLGVLLNAAVTLPRLPDAIIYMLGNRWSKGTLEFSLGLVFVFAWITLMVVALRQESPMNLLYFAGAVVIGPYLIIGIFWLLQHALAGAAAGVNAVAAFIISILGLPVCLLVCIRHDAESLAKVVGVARTGARL